MVSQLTNIQPTQNNTLAPTTGESPLADGYNPYGTATNTKATPQANAAAYAIQDFNQIFGRNPTQSELAQFVPAYLGNGQDLSVTAGKAQVAAYFNQFSNSPANLYSRQQQAWSSAAPQYTDQVNQLTQSTYGRQATPDEVQHYGTLLASGQADAYTLGQFMQSLPEYQNAQDTAFRNSLDQELQKSDQAFFDRTKGSIAQQYALMGRATSPALDVALTDLASQLSSQRQSYLAQLSASQYGGNKQAALDQYKTNQNDVTGRIDNNTNANYESYLTRMKNLNDLSDYNRQAADWTQAMGQYGNKGPGALDYLNAGLNTLNTGAKLYTAANTGGASAATPH